MTTASEHRALPRRLLLATDLSARCDRALDRAAQLAGEWQAELVALNVLDPTASPDQTLAWIRGAGDEELLRVARQRLARDLAAVDIPATLQLVRSENPTAAIRETAARTQAGLVVTAVSRNETLGRIFLGSTVESLARALPQPLLVVHHRASGPYRRILVASDFSGPSRHALLAALRLFPGRELILYHACALAMSGLSDALSRAGVGVAETECAAFMAATPLPEEAKVYPVVECGTIESALTRYVREHDIDLVVMGSHGRTGLMELLLGSTAARLLDWLPCDTLLVRVPPGSA
ncbi:universal stress protein [Zoogloea sp.]|uniref:universal stress protein n=1 Tax=Zoogloea sp. TaxID=49181 RepID=UPI0014164E03|nr:MAG: universal stress protein [Zoogloea sp.]